MKTTILCLLTSIVVTALCLAITITPSLESTSLPQTAQKDTDFLWSRPTTSSHVQYSRSDSGGGLNGAEIATIAVGAVLLAAFLVYQAVKCAKG